MKESTQCLLLSKADCKGPRFFPWNFRFLGIMTNPQLEKVSVSAELFWRSKNRENARKKRWHNKKNVLCKSHEGKRINIAIFGGGGGQTDESLNIYCSNSYVHILVKNSISVGLFVFVYEWTRLFSWEFTHRLQGHILRFIQFLTWRSLGAL